MISSLSQFHGLTYGDFYLLCDGKNILSSAALWKQTEYKQYVVKKYRGVMKFAHALNPILSALGYIKLPHEDKPLEFPMLSFFVSKNDSEEYYRIMLSEIKAEIEKRGEIFVIGLPSEHFASRIFDKLKSINFKTRLYEITFPWADKIYRTPDAKKLYPECGLL